MAFRYEEAVPWGRSFDEYRLMFRLTDGELSGRILGCADGPASFNARLFRQGHRVLSCDPLYACTAEQIRQRIAATDHSVMEQTRRNREKFVWERIASPEELGRVRMEAMQEFLADYEPGKREGRYVAAELPDLPFEAASFDLALCSHFLFLYSDNLSLEFHREAIDTLCRVAREVRLFPLLNYNAEPSPYVAPIRETLERAGRKVFLETVPYEFQRGGNAMMRITA